MAKECLLQCLVPLNSLHCHMAVCSSCVVLCRILVRIYSSWPVQSFRLRNSWPSLRMCLPNFFFTHSVRDIWWQQDFTFYLLFLLLLLLPLIFMWWSLYSEKDSEYKISTVRYLPLMIIFSRCVPLRRKRFSYYLKVHPIIRPPLSTVSILFIK